MRIARPLQPYPGSQWTYVFSGVAQGNYTLKVTAGPDGDTKTIQRSIKVRQGTPC
jgi:hypothetical protein